jgi:hypothetical protein
MEHLPLEFHLEIGKSKFGSGLPQGGPKFLRIGRRNQARFERPQAELGVDGRAECSFEEQFAHNVEFHVSQLLDTDPGGRAEQNDNGSAEAVIKHALKEGERSRQAAEGIEDEGRVPRRDALVEQAVVDVAAVRAEDRLAPEKAPDDGEKRIEQRKGESHQRGGHAQDGGRFLAPDDTQAAEHEADEQAAGIAEEDGSGIEVVAKETEEGARQRGDGNGQREITVQQGGDESGDGGEQADARSESVHAIDQIERIRAADEPQNSDGEGKPVANGERSEVPDLDTAAIGDDSRETLAGELLPGLEMDEIVGEADGEYDQGGREQLDNKDQLGGEDAAGVERQNEEETEGGEVGDDDRDTADARNRTLVNFTRIAGRIDQPEPDGPVSEQGRQQEGDGERAQSEKG